VLDAAILAGETVHCHPRTNDRTIELRTHDLVRYLEATGHTPALVDFDAAEPFAPR